MTLADWVALSQVIFNFVSVFAAIGTIGAAIYAVIVYKRNLMVEHAKWISSLYEKFYERPELKKVRDSLDCEANHEQVDELVLKEQKGQGDLSDYLNFFQFVAFLESSEQLTREEIKDMFNYYLRCLKRHDRVRKYIKESGYERLDSFLERWQ
jgi:hypothetical protein